MSPGGQGKLTHQEEQVRKFLLAGLVVAAVPVSMAFAESDGLKVTGGGQVLVTTQQGGGPGDNVGFVAQQTGELEDGVAPAKGQLQVIKRDPDATSGFGKPQVNFHGNVTCIMEFTDENGEGTEDDEVYIRFGGYQKVNGKQTTTPFNADVQDNGEGINATESDVIAFRSGGDSPCDEEDSTTMLRDITVARGNVQEH
jgi:hypothetical protein